MPWMMLTVAILSEVTGTTMMKLSDGFTKTWPTVGVIVFYGISFWLLSQTVRRLDVAVVYAIWSSVGTALVALVSWRLFGEPMTTLKVASMGLIIAGVVGLNLGGSH